MDEQTFDLINIGEASRILKLSLITLRKYEKEGVLKSVRPYPNAKRRFHRQDIIKLAERRT